MSDRLELNCALNISAETRRTQAYDLIESAEEGEDIRKRPGIVLFWPNERDDVWSIGKRYNVPVSDVLEMNGGSETLKKGRAIVLKI